MGQSTYPLRLVRAALQIEAQRLRDGRWTRPVVCVRYCPEYGKSMLAFCNGAARAGRCTP